MEIVVTRNDSEYTSDDLKTAYAAFLRAYPAYESTCALDDLRRTEYSRLDAQGHIYLDYTGGGLYGESQLRQQMALLQQGVFGNPHSENLTSLAMTRLVEQARNYVLEFFNASPSEYIVIFTQNATGALKLVGESYPFSPDSHYLLTFDNHNSVNGIREFAHHRGAHVTYVPLVPPDLRVDSEKLKRAFDLANPRGHNLFAYPAQSNFSGVQHPLEWIGEAKSKGWDVLLDAAAFAPTNRLDLSRWKPDFVDLSFYKIFGYPTGIGCLIARKETIHKLHRPWYAGGTITFSSVQGEGYYLTPGPAGFEDGTVNYLGLPGVEIGLRHIASIGMDTIHSRVVTLTAWLLDQLLTLRHSSGRPLVRVYGPTTMEMRGGTVEVNFYDPNGELIECNHVERLANDRMISLRAGCHCNPGAREISFGFSSEDMEVCFRDKDRMTYEQFLHVIDGKTTGAVRASLGIVTTFADVYRFVGFARSFLDKLQSAT
jgi:selenocysteine lyase/cysteine desulfurase